MNKLRRVTVNEGQTLRVGAVGSDELICLVHMDESGAVAWVTFPTGRTEDVPMLVRS